MHVQQNGTFSVAVIHAHHLTPILRHTATWLALLKRDQPGYCLCTSQAAHLLLPRIQLVWLA